MTNPHLGRAPVLAGASLGDAAVAALLVHGRDQDAAFMLDLVARLALDDVAYVLPEADQGTWYPGRYRDELVANEPLLSHALEAHHAALDAIHAAGVPPQRTVLVGFSQGACLVAELVFRTPAPYGGLAVLTGALIGPPGELRRPAAPLTGLPVICGCAREDAWIPLVDAQTTARAFAAAGADVTFAAYDEPEHAIYDAEVDAVRDLLRGAGAGA